MNPQFRRVLSIGKARTKEEHCHYLNLRENTKKRVGLERQSRGKHLQDISARCGMGACVMDVISLVVFVGSMYVAGRIAQRRGRSFKIWAAVAAIIGPLALALVFLFPNLHGKTGNPV
jgi:hypothetical protein